MKKKSWIFCHHFWMFVSLKVWRGPCSSICSTCRLHWCASAEAVHALTYLFFFLLLWDSSELQKQSCRISHAVSYFSGSALQVSFRHLSMLLLCPITYRLPTWCLCCFTCAENSLTRIQVNMPTNLRLHILMLPVNSLCPVANLFALVSMFLHICNNITYKSGNEPRAWPTPVSMQ